MKIMIAVLTLISTLAMMGCNTIEGAGKDLERGGEKLQESAKDVKRNL